MSATSVVTPATIFALASNQCTKASPLRKCPLLAPQSQLAFSRSTDDMPSLRDRLHFLPRSLRSVLDSSSTVHLVPTESPSKHESNLSWMSDDRLTDPFMNRSVVTIIPAPTPPPLPKAGEKSLPALPLDRSLPTTPRTSHRPSVRGSATAHVPPVPSVAAQLPQSSTPRDSHATTTVAPAPVSNETVPDPYRASYASTLLQPFYAASEPDFDDAKTESEGYAPSVYRRTQHLPSIRVQVPSPTDVAPPVPSATVTIARPASSASISTLHLSPKALRHASIMSTPSLSGLETIPDEDSSVYDCQTPRTVSIISAATVPTTTAPVATVPAVTTPAVTVPVATIPPVTVNTLPVTLPLRIHKKNIVAPPRPPPIQTNLAQPGPPRHPYSTATPRPTTPKLKRGKSTDILAPSQHQNIPPVPSHTTSSSSLPRSRSVSKPTIPSHVHAASTHAMVSRSNSGPSRYGKAPKSQSSTRHNPKALSDGEISVETVTMRQAMHHIKDWRRERYV